MLPPKVIDVLSVPPVVPVELSISMYDLAAVASCLVGEFGLEPFAEPFEPVERGLGASAKDIVDSRDLE